MMNENNVMQMKLQNLEQFFVGNPIQKEKRSEFIGQEVENLKDRIQILTKQNN